MYNVGEIDPWQPRQNNILTNRRRMCEDAAKVLGIESLRDVNPDEILLLESTFEDPIMFRRVRHVVSEIRRTQEAAEALDKGDYVTFGRLMIESHNSLRYFNLKDRLCVTDLVKFNSVKLAYGGQVLG